MSLYLPIAEISVDVPLILAIGLLAGFLSGIFGIGGGFISTPLLILSGIPPSVSVATSANQIVASSVSGVLSNLKKGGVDIKMGLYLLLGGMIGSSVGIVIFAILQKYGYVDLTVALIYVVLLGSIGTTMFINTGKQLIKKRFNVQFREKESKMLKKTLKIIDSIPNKTHFAKSDISVNKYVPIVLGALVGIIVSIIGIGGGFIMVPAMIYILRMPSNTVVGTSLFQISFVASNTTLLHAITNNTVDIVLSCLMILTSAIGAQLGSLYGNKSDADKMRFFLALLLICVCAKMLLSLIITPDNLYTFDVIER